MAMAGALASLAADLPFSQEVPINKVSLEKIMYSSFVSVHL